MSVGAVGWGVASNRTVREEATSDIEHFPIGSTTDTHRKLRTEIFRINTEKHAKGAG